MVSETRTHFKTLFYCGRSKWPLNPDKAFAGMVGTAVLAMMALGADPNANAAPVPGCLQAPSPGCGRRAFLADVGAAGFRDARGGSVALQQGMDICDLMDAGVSRQNMVNQFWALNPALGPDGAAQVVGIAIRDLCPWHR